ncbi:hypothetical protein M8C21_006902, partial [Ambrosia artemisiifolia]
WCWVVALDLEAWWWWSQEKGNNAEREREENEYGQRGRDEIETLCRYKFVTSDKAATELLWKTRLAIALEIGSAIQYLHEEFVDGSIVNLSICSSHVGLVDRSSGTALPHLEKNIISPLLDPRLTEPSDPEVAHMARAALACLKNDSCPCLKISKVLAIVRGDQ